jgi:hypothetical protein
VTEYILILQFDSTNLNLHFQVDRHLRKLDQELSKFKMELEADNAGITEVLEKSMYCMI